MIFEAITLSKFRWKQNYISIKFELRNKFFFVNQVAGQNPKTLKYIVQRVSAKVIRYVVNLILVFVAYSMSVAKTDHGSTKTTTHWEWAVGHDDTMTSSNGNIFRVTGPLCGEFTDYRWIPLTKVSDAEVWCFLYKLCLNKRLSKQSRRRWFETPLRSLWRHCNGHYIETLPAYHGDSNHRQISPFVRMCLG